MAIDPTRLAALDAGFQSAVDAGQIELPTRGRGGFLTSLIGELGGIGGTAGGAAIGTAILPGLGTIIGGGLGGFLGGGAGTAVEQQVRDDEIRLGDVLKEATLSGVMGAGPIRLAKGGLAAGRAATAASKAGTSLGAGQLANVFGKAATTKGLKAGFAKGAGISDDILRQVGKGQSDDLARALLPDQVTPRGRFSPSFQQEIIDEASGVTRAHGAVKNIGVKDASSGAFDVAVRSKTRSLDDIAQEAFGYTRRGTAKLGKKQLTAARNQLLPKSGRSSLSVKEQDEFVETVIRLGGKDVRGKSAFQISREYDSIVGKARAVADEALESANKTMLGDDIIKEFDTLAGKVGKKGSLTRDNFEATVKRVLGDNGVTSGKKVTATQLNNVKRALNTDIVKIKAKDKLTGLANKDIATLNFGDKIDDSIKRLMDSDAFKLYKDANKDMAILLDDKGGRKLLEKAAEAQTSFGGIVGRVPGISRATAVGQQKAAGRIAQEAPETALRAGLGGAARGALAQALTAPSPAAPSVSQPQLNLGSPQQVLGAQSPAGLGGGLPEPSQPQNLFQALQDPQVAQMMLLQALQQGATLDEAIGSITDLMKLGQMFGVGGTGKKLSAEQQKAANNAGSALRDIQIIRQEVSRDPGVTNKAMISVGPLAGVIDRATGAGEFEAARRNVIDVLARLRSGAAITDFEFESYSQLIPQVGDTPDLVDSKLSRLEEIFSGFADPQEAAQPDLATALTQGVL